MRIVLSPCGAVVPSGTSFAPISPLFSLYSCCTAGTRFTTVLAILEGFPLFKDPLLIDVRVMRNLVRVPAYSTNFRNRVSSFKQRGNSSVFRFMKAHAMEFLPFYFLVDCFPKRVERLP